MKKSAACVLKVVLLHLLVVVCFPAFLSGVVLAQESDTLLSPMKNAVRDTFQFNGYTNHWQDVYRDWYRYGGLFIIAEDDVEKDILQSKVDVAADMGFPGLLMQEGFLKGLISAPFQEIIQPATAGLESVLGDKNTLVFVNVESDLGKRLDAKLPADFCWPSHLGSHQYSAEDLIRVNAFFLEHGGKKLFVVSSTDTASLRRVRELIRKTLEVVNIYDFYKGLFGAKTLEKSVTCGPGNYLDVIGKGMNEGDSWFIFDGYMDFLAKDELQAWMDAVGLPVVTDVGFRPVYGCRDWEGLQTQRMFTRESWLRFAKEKGGYIFRPVYGQIGRAHV